MNFVNSYLKDGTKIFIASADKQVRLWDLASNQMVVVGAVSDSSFLLVFFKKNPFYGIFIHTISLVAIIIVDNFEHSNASYFI